MKEFEWTALLVLLICLSISSPFPSFAMSAASAKKVTESGSVLDEAQDTLNGLDIALSFMPEGIGLGRLTVSVQVLEDVTSVDISLSLPEGVRLAEGSPEITARAAAGETHVHVFTVEVSERGEFPVQVTALGTGGVREMSASETIFLTRDASGVLSSQPHASLPSEPLQALPLPIGAVVEAAAGSGHATTTPPPEENPPDLESPDQPEVQTALTVTGCFYYVDADGSYVGARNIWVRVWDDDILFDDLLWSGVAGSDGCWTATGLSMEEEFPSGNQDIFVQYSTWTNPSGKVVDTLLSYYTSYTPTTNEVSSSPFDSGSWIPSSDVNYRAAYRVYAYLEEAWQFDCVKGVGQDCMSEPTAVAVVPGDGTYYQRADEMIRIEVNGDYDRSRDVVTHERGHWVMDQLVYERSYWPPGAGGSHTWCGLYNQGMAFSEGWATFYAVAKGNWLDGSDTSFDYGSGSSMDIESGQDCPSSVTGDENEYRVAGSLWDVMDARVDGKDAFSSSWSIIWAVADDCTHPSFREFYDGTCSWVSHGFERRSLVFPAWQNYIDYNVAPTATVFFPNGGEWLGGTVSIIVTSFDLDTPITEVFFYVSHDSLTSSCQLIGSSTSAPYSILWDTRTFGDDPTAYVCAKAYDGLEYSSIDLSDSAFGVDNTPPISSATLSGTLGNNGWYVSAVLISHTAIDVLSGVKTLEYNLDIQGWTPHLGSFTISDDGTHTLSYSATDVAGNVETPQSLQFKIDRTPPTSSVTPLPSYLNTRGFAIAFTVTDNAEGSGFLCATLYHRFNGGSWTSYTTVWAVGQISFGASADGTYDFYTVATDLAGNTEPAPTVPDTSTVVDTVMPIVTISQPLPLQYLNSSSVSVAWVGDDSGSGISRYAIALDAGQPENVSQSLTHVYDGVSEGLHTVTVTAFDKAGNSAEKSVNFGIDVTAPSLTIQQPQSGQKFLENTVVVSWTGSDSGSGIDHYEIGLGGGEYMSTGSKTTYTLSGLSEGSHTVSVRAIDRAGNVREETRIFTVHTDFLTGGGPHGWLLPYLIAILLALAVVSIVVFIIWRKRRRKEQEPVESAYTPHEIEEFQEENEIEPPSDDSQVGDP